MAIPADLPVGTQDMPAAPRKRRNVAVTAQFLAMPDRVPPLRLMSIAGAGLSSVALK